MSPDGCVQIKPSAKHEDKSVKLEDERIPEDYREEWDGVTRGDTAVI